MNPPGTKSVGASSHKRPPNTFLDRTSAPEFRASLKEAKDRLDVRALWHLLGLTGAPGRNIRCPFHDDHSPSFSVYDGAGGAARWKCHTGCGGGGPVELIARALEISDRAACRRLIELANGEKIDTPIIARPRRIKTALGTFRRPTLPPRLHHGSRAEIRALAAHRGLSLDALMLTQQRGLLWFAEVHNNLSWIVTDQARANAQARRMDGHLWEHIGGKKAYTLPGSRAAWPIGTKEAVTFSYVMLVEGGPDLLAAHHFIAAEGREADVAAVAVLGAANPIPEDALLLFAHKRIRLFPHTDAAGQVAAVRWADALERVGCEVDAFSFEGLQKTDGASVADLNDFALLDADCFEAERAELLEVLPR